MERYSLEVLAEECQGMMEENSSENSSLKESTENSAKCLDNSLRDFSKYQTILLVLTQLGYLPIAACLLVTSVFSPPAGYCTNGTVDGTVEVDFYSLLLEWEMACTQPNIKSIVSTSIMLGGLLGAFVTGYIADTYGRRPALLGTLMSISIGCLLVSLIGEYSWIATTLILGVLGAACGGYMVVNLTLVVEFLCTSRSRLLVVCVNGWPLSMAATAALAYLSAHWRPYFIVTAVVSTIVLVLLYLWSMESVRWLASKNRVRDAVSIAQKVIKKNGDANGSEFLLQVASRGKSSQVESDTKNYLYLDLLKFPSVRKPLLALTYCFVSSSIVSFGYYLFIDTIPGNRFTNFAVMGLLKFFCGLIPFLLSFVGRRPLVLLSLGVACTASYSILAFYFLSLPTSHWLYGFLSIIAASAIDPAWKVNHLYSAELFPTAVRSMARAVCNIGGRLGSVAAPWVVGLDAFTFVGPYSVFTVLLTVQWIVSLLYLPETRNKPLVERIIEVDGETDQTDLQFENQIDLEKAQKI